VIAHADDGRAAHVLQDQAEIADQLARRDRISGEPRMQRLGQTGGARRRAAGHERTRDFPMRAVILAHAGIGTW